MQYQELPLCLMLPLPRTLTPCLNPSSMQYQELTPCCNMTPCLTPSYGLPFDAAGTNHTLFGVATNDAGFFRARVSPIAEVSEKSD